MSTGVSLVHIPVKGSEAVRGGPEGRESLFSHVFLTLPPTSKLWLVVDDLGGSNLRILLKLNV